MSEDQTQKVLDKHNKYMSAPLTYYEDPLVVDKAKGMFVTDMDGREYLDFFGGILTVSIGHCDDRINKAIHVQNMRLQHISTLYPTTPIVELAETMARITPGRLEKTFFTCSGTEADETAVMLAINHTKRTEIIALRHGYSGRSLLAQSLTAHSPWRIVSSQIAGIKHAHNPYCYRCPYGATPEHCGLRCAEDIEALIRTTTSGQIAGFLAEPIQGVGGFIVPPKEYFKVAVEIVRKYGGLFICDEVQTGFGRTGDKMFGIEHFDVDPDIMTMAKGIANGLPLGATVSTPEVADSMKGLSLSTFGGNPVSCVASQATIGIIEEEDLLTRNRQLGDHLRQGLDAMKDRFSCIGDVRGMGLMQGIEFVENEPAGDRTPNAQVAGQLMEQCRKEGLLVGKGGLDGNVLRISPPMIVTRDQVDDALKTIESSLEQITG
jgi:4-aminobutyrate aminotransferase-like enzyme